MKLLKLSKRNGSFFKRAQGMFFQREEGGQGSSPRRVVVKKECFVFKRAQGMFFFGKFFLRDVCSHWWHGTQ